MTAVPRHSFVWKVENWIVPIKRSTDDLCVESNIPRRALHRIFHETAGAEPARYRAAGRSEQAHVSA
jgi:methylphosphotriester-DNA--protein-cysteine methyltransferase